MSFPFSRKSSSSAWQGRWDAASTSNHPITQRRNTKVLPLASSRIQPPTRCFRRDLELRHARVRYLIL
ncbi:hypothetical protein V8C40DRAFT_255437 [Trichoderma camerunense]